VIFISLYHAKTDLHLSKKQYYLLYSKKESVRLVGV